MSDRAGRDAERTKPEDHTDIVVMVRGGCVKSVRRKDGTPILVTLYDYDVHEVDINLPHQDIATDERGEHFERLIA